MAYDIVTKNTVRDRFKSNPRPGIWTDVPEKDWNNWVWQQQKRIKSFDVLEKVINVTQEEREAFAKSHEQFNMGITPYYASLMDKDDPNCPIRLQSVPKMGELFVSPVDLEDPLGEEKDMPVPGVTHRYPDRVLFLALDRCAIYCRHCNRRRLVGQESGLLAQPVLEAGLDYIRRTPAIKDVLISGGDPLTLSTDKLEWLLSSLRAIPHVEGDGAGPAAKGLDFLPESVELGDVAARHRDVGAGLREGAGEMLAEAAAGPRHEGDLAGEAEERGRHQAWGARMTFITPGAPAWSLANQSAPCASGATAEMILSTLICWVASNSMQRGISPAEAQDPWRRS